MRKFNTGATRDDDKEKPDYEGFLSPLVIKRYGEYMSKHRVQADGKIRASDNWQQGIPKDAYMKSLWRHLMDLWMEHRGHVSRDGIEDAICGIMFNSMGYLHEILKEKTLIEELSDRISNALVGKTVYTKEMINYSLMNFKCRHKFNPVDLKCVKCGKSKAEIEDEQDEKKRTKGTRT